MTNDSSINSPEARRKKKRTPDVGAAFSATQNPEDDGQKGASPQTPDEFLNNFLLFLARFFNPDALDNNEADAEATEQVSDALGFDPAEDHRDYRDWNRRQRETGWENPQAGLPDKKPDPARTTAILTNPAIPAAAATAAAATIRGSYGTMTGQQQRTVAALSDAARVTGVSSDFLVGLWGYESNFGKKTLSPTGCRGDFQFTRATMREVMQNHGAEIASLLKDQRMYQQADLVIRSGGGRGTNAQIDALRDSPEVSAYAAAFYIKDVSKRLGLDPQQQKNWGYMYASYNIGEGNARKLMAGQLATGREVDVQAGTLRGHNTAASQTAAYEKAIIQASESPTGLSLIHATAARPTPQQQPTLVADARDAQRTQNTPTKPAV